MTSNVSPASSTTARQYLEWVVVALSLVVGIWVAVAGIGYGLTNAIGVGAGFFPFVAGGVISLGAVLWGLQLLGDIRARRRPADPDHPDALFDVHRANPATDTAIGVLVVDGVDEEDDDVSLPDRKGLRRVAIVVGALVAAAILLPLLGYALTMVLLLFVMMFFVSERRWWIALLVAVGISFLSRLLFENLLGTALPHSAFDLLRAIGL